MGQGASYAESSIQQSLVRLLSKEAALEQEQLRCCGLDDDSLSVLAAISGDGHAPVNGHDSDTETRSTRSASLRESFGPLVNVAPAFYTIDELREALPLLPDTLWVSLHRITLLYLLDADGDGRVSRSDVARFTDWAIENIPESVPSEQLAEVLHAQAALHCWHRCLARAAEEEEAARTGRINGPSRPPNTSAPPPSALAQTRAPASSELAASHSHTSPRAPPTPANYTHGSLTNTASGRGSITDSAAMHFSHWVLLFVARQEAARRRRRQLVVRRGRLMRRAQATPTGTTVSRPTSTTPKSTTSTAATAAAAAAPSAAISSSASPTTSAFAAWPARTTQQVAQLELDEDAVEVMLQDCPARWRVIEKEELFTASGVEEIYIDLGVLESAGLSFWGFCRLLDAAAATEVEKALGLASEQAEHEITCAAVLDEMRSLAAVNHLPSPAGSAEDQAPVRRARTGSGGSTSGGPAHSRSSSSLSSASTAHRAAPSEASTTAERRAPLVPERRTGPRADAAGETGDGASAAIRIPDFVVSRYVLQPFVFCFVHSYWNLLRSMGFDPALVGDGKTHDEDA